MVEISSLEAKWEHLRLLEEELQPISLGDETPTEYFIMVRHCEVGKLCSERSVGMEVLRATMGKIWCISRPALFKVVGQNIFTNSFATKADK